MGESDPLEGSKGRGRGGGASLPLASLFQSFHPLCSPWLLVHN